MACDNLDVIIEPMLVSFGRQEVTCVTPVFPVVESSYILISDQTTDYYLWQNDGLGVDPLIAGRTGIEIDTSAATDAAGVASAWVTALEADGSLYANISSDGLSLEITTIGVGVVLNATADGGVATGAALETLALGAGGDLGPTQEAIEVTMSIEYTDITTNQTAGLLADRYINNIGVSASMTLAAVTEQLWDNIIGSYFGGKYTPGGGTEVIGVGSGSLNKSFQNIGGLLVLHPVARAASDRSRDITIFKTVPTPESINFDGLAQQGMSVTFEGIVDPSIQSSINLLGFGDSSQDLRA